MSEIINSIEKLGGGKRGVINQTTVNGFINVFEYEDEYVIQLGSYQTSDAQIPAGAWKKYAISFLPTGSNRFYGLGYTADYNNSTLYHVFVGISDGNLMIKPFAIIPSGGFMFGSQLIVK